MKRNRIALVMPWVGKRPWYWELWRQSAAGLPMDVIAIEQPIEYFREKVKKVDGGDCGRQMFDFNISRPMSY